VETATNGKLALDRLSDGARPDIILLDLMMPVMNGWEFLRAFQDDAKIREIPVVVVSAFADREQPAGTAGMIKKPVSIDELMAMLHQVTGK
jgi:CheY-like chemotaxis protein